METDSVTRYPAAIRLLHWLMALLVIGLLAAGLVMTGMDHNDPLRPVLFRLHKSIGVTVLALALLRLCLRFALPIPKLPEAIEPSERFLATAGHYTLYLFMLMLPISGYLLTNAFGIRLYWFGVPLPRLFAVNPGAGKLAAQFHEWAAYLLIGFITLHVTAVIWHYARQRINLLRRMW